jgi:hypothetical protein
VGGGLRPGLCRTPPHLALHRRAEAGKIGVGKIG